VIESDCVFQASMSILTVSLEFSKPN
jgi:hypothetical protein